MIDLYGSSVAFAAVAHSTQWTFRTIGSSVYWCVRYVSQVRYGPLVCNMLHVLSHRAYVEVLLLIIEHVRFSRSSLVISTWGSLKFSSARTASASFRIPSTLAISLALFFSTDPFQTKVYLFATDSIFVPSIYCTSKDMSPSSWSNSTTWWKMDSKRPSASLSLMKRLMVWSQGGSFRSATWRTRSPPAKKLCDDQNRCLSDRQHDYLEQHTRMITRCAASFVGGFDFAYIEVVKKCIYGAYWMIFRNEVTNAWWKKKIIFLSVRFI